MILGLFTGLTGAGGIQRVSRHVAAILTVLAEKYGETHCLLSLNDPSGYHEGLVGETTFTFRGFGRHKLRFVFEAVRQVPETNLAYLNHPHLAPVGLCIKLLNPKARCIIATHGFETWTPLPMLYRWCFRRASVITAPSRYTADKTVETQKIGKNKVIVLPWGLDPSFDGLRCNLTANGLLQKGKMILTVSRLNVSDRYKGVETVLRALPAVRSKVPDVHYVVVGDGGDRPRLEHLCGKMDISDCAVFVGMKSDEELASYYQTCHAFVMPSRKEGFGLVFLEAMASGKPVIGGNHGGTPDVVVDGVTGFLVEYGDVEALTDRMITLLTDDDLRRSMGEAGRQRVLESYTFEHFRKRLFDLLEKEG